MFLKSHPLDDWSDPKIPPSPTEIYVNGVNLISVRWSASEEGQAIWRVAFCHLYIWFARAIESTREIHNRNVDSNVRLKRLNCQFRQVEEDVFRVFCGGSTLSIYSEQSLKGLNECNCSRCWCFRSLYTHIHVKYRDPMNLVNAVLINNFVSMRIQDCG